MRLLHGVDGEPANRGDRLGIDFVERAVGRGRPNQEARDGSMFPAAFRPLNDTRSRGPKNCPCCPLVQEGRIAGARRTCRFPFFPN